MEHDLMLRSIKMLIGLKNEPSESITYKAFHIEAKDADAIYQNSKPIYEYFNSGNQLQHKRYPGRHAMTEERFDYIVNWFCGHIS